MMKVGNCIRAERANWSFGNKVAEHFDEHIRRSVPLYDRGHELVCHLSDFFCLSDSLAYELGCATGNLLKRLAIHNKHKPKIRWVGIDAEPEMIQAAEQNCRDIKNIELHKDDILNFDYQKSDFIVSYYTIQFIPARHRQEIFNKIYETLNWGGAFLLFEKVRAPDARFQDITTSLYNDFKKRNDFTAEEIIGKSEALRGALEPFSSQGNIDLLKRAGFVDYMTVLKDVCFEGFLAIK